MFQMAKIKTFWCWPRTLALALMLTGAVVGCSREEAPAVDPSSPASYLNDQEFMGKLKRQEQAKQSLIKRHLELKREYDQENAQAPGSARAQELKAQLEELAREFEASTRQTEAIVRQRLKPTQPKQ